MAQQTFKTRRVGRTSLEVTELGLGGATLAGMLGSDVPPEQARATVSAALDAGIGYFDTAPMYGYGRSEHFVGDALRFRQEGKVVSTKVGRLLRPVRSDAERTYSASAWTQPFPFDIVYDYSYDGVMRSFEASLQRLGLPKVDILYVHDIGVQTHGVEQNKRHWEQLAGGGYRALNELKSQHLISAIGLGVNEWQAALDAFAVGDWDVFLLAGRYTLLEQGSLSPFLSTCVDRGASVVVGGPFNGGALAGTDIWGPPTGVYDKTPAAVVARINALRQFCKTQDVPLAAAALRFPLAHPAVCNVVPGPKSPQELEGILGWWNTPIPDSFWDGLADQKLVAEGTPLPNGRVA